MASSGSINGSFNGTSTSSISFRVDWKVTGQDFAARTSTVQFKYICRRSSTQRTTYKDDAPWGLTASGSVTGTVDFDIRNTAVNTDYVFLTRNRTITHENDGTKSLTVSGYIDLSGTSAGVGSFSQAITLPTIPVAPPTFVSFGLSDVGNSIQSGLYVATQSVLKLDAEAQANATGASVAKFEFYRNDVLIYTDDSGNTTASFTSPNPAVAGTYTYKCIVYDSYGLTATDTLAAITVQPYSLPVITSTETSRSGSDASVKASWTYANVGPNAANCVVTANGYSKNLTNGVADTVGNGTLLPTSAWQIVYVVTDSFGSTATKTDVIYSAFKNFNLAPDKTVGGFAFGEVATVGKGIFNVPEVLARGDAEVVGDLVVGGDTNASGDITASGTVTAGDFSASVSVITNAITISTSGITIEEQGCVRFGRVATIMLRISGTIAAGASVSGDITSDWFPAVRSTGAGYYSQSPFIIQIATDGGITIRNASANSRTPTSGTPLTVSATYILA